MTCSLIPNGVIQKSVELHHRPIDKQPYNASIIPVHVCYRQPDCTVAVPFPNSSSNIKLLDVLLLTANDTYMYVYIE